MKIRQNINRLVTKGILLCFVFALLPTQAFASESLEKEPTVVVTEDELVAAVAAANDGDTITIGDSIVFEECVNLGSADKTVILLRGSGNVYISFLNDGAESPSIITNLVFDGDNRSDNTSGMAFVTISRNMSFKNCQFKNSPRTCAVQITEAFIDIEFTDCLFSENHNIWGYGGHIDIGNAASVTLNHCRLENGSAMNAGGAISLLTNASYFINDSVITGNETPGLGGGIYAPTSDNTVSIANSQIYHNRASQGADIATGMDTALSISGTGEPNAEYEEKDLTPLGWAIDYGIVPEGDLWNYIGNMSMVYLKMAFEEKEPEPIVIKETVTIKEPVYITETDTKVVEKIVEVPMEEKREPVTLQCGEVILDREHPVELQGYGNGDLGLNDPVTRAQMAQILYRQMESKIERTDTGLQFPDVRETDWFYEPVMTMADAGVIVGSNDGCYHPDDPVTWAQMITMLYRFTELEPTCHIITEHWAKDAINTAIEQGWIDYTDQFEPDAPANRGEVQLFVNTVLTWAQGE